MRKEKYLRNQKRQHHRGFIERQRRKREQGRDQYFKAIKSSKPPKIIYKPAPSKGWRRVRLVMSYFFRNLVVFLVYRVLAVYSWITGKRGKTTGKRLHKRVPAGPKQDS